jgi:uncharacterized protein
MVIAILQFELLIPGAASLKDKRRVVASLKDRLHREHQVSVAEVGLLDRPGAARLALALVATDGRYAGQVLDRITGKLRGLHDAELGDCTREMIEGSPVAEVEPEPPADPALDAELLRRGQAAQEGA